MAVAEIVFRLPPVVARTGGYTPGLRRWEQENYDRIWETHELGLRTLHGNLQKPAGVTRIVVLGDSFSWGDKIARTEDVWPFVLERELVRRGWTAEVVNLAQRGFTSVNEAVQLEEVGWGLDPDVVVQQFYLNDPLPSGPRYRRVGEDWLFRPWRLAPWGHETLDRSSYLYSFANARFGILQRRFRRVRGYEALYHDDFAGWQAARRAIAAMASSAEARGVRFLAVVFPTFSAAGLGRDGYPHLALHDEIRAAYAEQGVPLLDLRERFAERDPDARSWWALPNDAHPNAEAHALAGRAVAAWLDDRQSARPR